MTNEARDLAFELAPELRGRFEVLHCPDWQAPSRCQAFTSLGRNLDIRDALIKQDRWPGQFPTTVVFLSEPTVELLLHETGHALPAREPLPYIEPTELEREVQAVDLQRWASGEHYRDPDRPPWTGHDARWIRRLVHLWHRAERLGRSINPNRLNAGDCYGLSHISEYAARFASEPAMNSHKSFASIDRMPFPDPVLKLFSDDVKLWAINSLMGATE